VVQREVFFKGRETLFEYAVCCFSPSFALFTKNGLKKGGIWPKNPRKIKELILKKSKCSVLNENLEVV